MSTKEYRADYYKRNKDKWAKYSSDTEKTNARPAELVSFAKEILRRYE